MSDYREQCPFSPVSIYNRNTMCVVRDIIIYVRGVISSIHEDIFMSTHRIYHFLCNCAVMNGCSGHFPLNNCSGIYILCNMCFPAIFKAFCSIPYELSGSLYLRDFLLLCAVVCLHVFTMKLSMAAFSPLDSKRSMMPALISCQSILSALYDRVRKSCEMFHASLDKIRN